jgi:hypothetical protein
LCSAQHQLLVAEPRLQHLGVISIRKQELDAAKSGGGRRLEALEKIDLTEQHRQVRGQSGHGGSL